MERTIDRRRFVHRTAASGAALTLAAGGVGWAASPSSRISVGIMGAGGRGSDLAKSFQRLDGVDLCYVCDPDSRRAADLTAALAKDQDKPITPVADFRKILDDDQIDVLVVATPNHWHAPATILACDAGKHVYVEKPCSHNPAEGERMVAAARANNRCVQMGTQRRSSPELKELIAQIHEGVIGEVLFTRTYYGNLRGEIGNAQPTTAPADLDFDLWLGPAPKRPYQENLLHYNWHWFWDFGNGEAGNNGVHYIDVARWGMGVGHPVRVTSTGGRYFYDDDQQTPDTNVVTLEYEGGRMIRWEGTSCTRHDGDDIVFHGTEGSIALRGQSFRILGRDGKAQREGKMSVSNEPHIANFLQAIRDSQPSSLAAEIDEGHRSTLATELANISYRVGRELNCEASTGRIRDNEEAMRLWSREYSPGWRERLKIHSGASS